MSAEFIEKHDTFADMKPGNVAVSIDRKKLFVCAYAVLVDRETGEKTYKNVIVDLNKLHDQYLDRINDKTPIKKLARGDKFIITVEYQGEGE